MDNIFKDNNHYSLPSLQSALKSCVQKDPNIWFQARDEAIKAIDSMTVEYQRQIEENMRKGCITEPRVQAQLEKLRTIREEISTSANYQNLKRKDALQLLLFHWITLLKQRGFTGIEKELKTHGLKRPLSYQRLLLGNLTITQFVILAVVTIVMYLIFRILRGF